MPFKISEERMASSKESANENCGGRFIGDELAKKGYVCFADSRGTISSECSPLTP